jgi:hypothetical protein
MPVKTWQNVTQHYRTQTWRHGGSWPDTSKAPTEDTGPKTKTIINYTQYLPEGTTGESCPAGNVELVTVSYDDQTGDVWEDIDHWKQWKEQDTSFTSEGSGYPSSMTLYYKEHYTSKTISKSGYKSWECIPIELFEELKDLFKHFSWSAQPHAAEREPAEVR